MKIYESAYTYFPFVYLYVMSTTFGAFYHNSYLARFQPYIIMSYSLVNVFVYYIHDTDRLIKHVIHRHIWKTVTLTIAGIMLNNIHNEMFRDFHFVSHNTNMLVSLFYSVSILVSSYYFNYIGGSVIIHVIFGFFPLSRVWQVNLYMYVVYTTLSIILMYRRIYVRDLNDNSYHIRPVVNFFMYLRLHDMFIVLGILQLYIEYYKSAMPDKRAMEELTSMLEKERQIIYKKRTDSEESLIEESTSV